MIETHPTEKKAEEVLSFKMARTAFMRGMGLSVPSRVVSNKDLEAIVQTSDEWIVTRTGISERRIGGPDLATSDLCLEAAQKALKDAGASAKEIDLIIICTVTPDTTVPSTACWIQHKLGASRAAAFDINAGCTGFMYGLAVGSQFISSGAYQNVLVIGADMLSRITNWKDRSTCILFGDGAGAVILAPSKQVDRGLLDFYLRSDGSGGNMLIVEAGGSRLPASAQTVQTGQHAIRMEGRPVFRFAVNAILDSVHKLLSRENLRIEDIDCFIFHQANIRILESAAKYLNISMEKVFTNVQHYGNTSSASVPLALIEARQEKRIKEGSYVIMVGFGAGLTWGSCLMRL